MGKYKLTIDTMPVAKINRLKAIFKAVTGETFNIRSYMHRLMLQKMTYILGMKDLSLHYRFSWYIRGPYSPDLTDEEYANPETVSPLSENDNNKVDFVKQLMENDVDDNKLELYASILYLIRHRLISDEEEIFSSIQAVKPWFDREEVIHATRRIKQFFNS